MFIISRIATQNPAINGRTLYMTGLGLWSLDRALAKRMSQEGAEEVARIYKTAQIEEA